MKVPKHKSRRTGGIPVRSLLAQPPSAFYRLPDFEMRGGFLTTDGCRRVLDFAPEKICLDMGNFLVTLYGAELQIESLAGKRLILAGKIKGITFQNKWEDSSHET